MSCVDIIEAFINIIIAIATVYAAISATCTAAKSNEIAKQSFAIAKRAYVHSQSDKISVWLAPGKYGADIILRNGSELRMLVFDGIVTIEIYLKSFLAYELSVFGGEFGYMTREGLPGLSYDDHLACLSSLRPTFTKSNLPYLKHFRSTYSNPLPPYWMIVGCLSYGTLKENFYQGAPDYIKRKLATKLHIFNPNPNPAVRGDAKILSNWLETIRQARNMTAHHDRFWNETSTRIAPKLPKHRSGSHAKDWWGNDWDIFRRSSGPAAFLTMENYLTSRIDGPAWTEKFISLMDRYPQIPKSDMGFPDEWRMSPLWQIDSSAH
ncbi:Abi-like protein [Bifidobacterium hapali]|uniref:Abi-like protein n=1 Tax=Bifidobacterium hapali TaxID=1630172 RepID=A0A261FSI0_9BIFI|nr:Abi family protein [Bifidobacterium hapali]OZG62107.1 Abi-like protein [Bifidobacterium hapali]